MIIITEYVYTADGVKLKTIHRTAVDGIVTYSNNFELIEREILSKDSTVYVGSFEMNSSKDKMYHFANGYIDIEQGHVKAYCYSVKDHLGNVRHVDRAGLDNRGNEIVQVSNYYSYGGVHTDVDNGVDVQNHLYNGKELGRIHGLNLYDYSARQYDAALGQFTSMDPLCEKYYHISPYAYCAGNPVNRRDLNGDSITIFAGDETFVYSPGSAYGGENEFIKNTCKYLNELNKKGGNKLLTELYQSEKMIKFKEGEITYFKEDRTWKAGIALMRDPKKLLSNYVGCGGTIYVNFQQGITYPTEYEDNEVHWYVVFGHELKHASNANNGIMNGQAYDPFHEDPNLRSVSKDEQSAMYYENYLRAKNGLPLRTAYSTYQGCDFFPFDFTVNSLPYIPN